MKRARSDEESQDNKRVTTDIEIVRDRLDTIIQPLEDHFDTDGWTLGDLLIVEDVLRYVNRRLHQHRLQFLGCAPIPLIFWYDDLDQEVGIAWKNAPDDTKAHNNAILQSPELTRAVLRRLNNRHYYVAVGSRFGATTLRMGSWWLAINTATITHAMIESLV